jgi:hypothetical protein
MGITEQLARYIFQCIDLDLTEENSSDKKVLYQLLYIGLTKIYGGEHLSPRDVDAFFYTADTGINTIRVNVLGKELYFFKYGNQIQALTSDSDVILNIDLYANNTFELYVKNTFNTTFRYGIEKVVGNNADRYTYQECQGDKNILHGDLVTSANSKTNNNFKLIVYDLNTNEVISDDESFFKKLSDSIKKDDSTNTNVTISYEDSTAQINNLIGIYSVLKMKLNKFYQSKKNAKTRVKKR